MRRPFPFSLRYPISVISKDPVAPFLTQLEQQPLSTPVLDVRAFQLTKDQIIRLHLIVGKNKMVGRIQWHSAQSTLTPQDLADIEQMLAERRRSFLDKPSDYCYGLCSQRAYRRDGGYLSPETGLIKERVFDQALEQDGCFAVVYEHPASRHYIVAFSGTNPAYVPKLIKDINADINGIVRLGITSQQISALEFVLQMKQVAEAQGYRLGLTGHSLGGWLAQLCVYHLALQGYRAHGVVFDAPSASETMRLLQPDDATARVDLSRMDITRYCSAPNLINTCSHEGTSKEAEVGTLYRIYPELPASSGLGKYFYSTLGGVQYNQQTHSLDGILKIFDPSLGYPKKLDRMLKWPHTYWPEKPVPGFLSQWTALIPGFQWINYLPNKIVHKIASKVPYAEEITGIVGMLTDFSGDQIEQGQYRLFHQYANESNHFQPDFTRLSSAADYHLRHAGHYDAIGFNEKILSLRHFHPEILDFLKRYEKYQAQDSLDITGFFEVIGLDQNSQAKIKQLLHFHMDERFNLIVDASSSAASALEFRRQVACWLTYYPELKQLHKYKYHTISYLTQRIQALELNDFKKELKEIKEKIDAQWEANYDLLNNLVALYPQARLYLYGQATAEEIKRHEVEGQQLAKQLALNQRVHEQLQQAQQNKPQLSEDLAALQADITQQRYQLQLASLMNQTLYHQKSQRFKEAQAQLDSIFRLLEETSVTVWQDNKNPLFSLSRLKASLYTLQGKIQRASLPKDQWLKTVLVSYQQALKEPPQHPAILSSQGALLDDLGQHPEAESYHRKAIKQQQPKLEAVTLSNLGWCLYHQALQAPDPMKKKQLFEEALDCYEQSLEKNAYLAGTWLYLGLLKQAIGDDQTALKHFTQGLNTQPDYAKLLYERAKLYNRLSQWDQAQTDAEKANRLLAAKVSDSPDYAELRQAVTVLMEELANQLPAEQPSKIFSLS